MNYEKIVEVITSGGDEVKVYAYCTTDYSIISHYTIISNEYTKLCDDIYKLSRILHNKFKINNIENHISHYIKNNKTVYINKQKTLCKIFDYIKNIIVYTMEIKILDLYYTIDKDLYSINIMCRCDNILANEKFIEKYIRIKLKDKFSCIDTIDVISFECHSGYNNVHISISLI